MIINWKYFTESSPIMSNQQHNNPIRAKQDYALGQNKCNFVTNTHLHDSTYKVFLNVHTFWRNVVNQSHAENSGALASNVPR